MLEFKNITASCQHQIILKNISITVPTGEITCIIGPNGCGKQRLYNVFMEYQKVIEGTILLNGYDFFLQLSYRERAKQLSFFPQVRQIIPTLPVKTLVEHGRFPYLGFARKQKARYRYCKSSYGFYTDNPPILICVLTPFQEE